jgi:hypothetical protein
MLNLTKISHLMSITLIFMPESNDGWMKSNKTFLNTNALFCHGTALGWTEVRVIEYFAFRCPLVCFKRKENRFEHILRMTTDSRRYY